MIAKYCALALLHVLHFFIRCTIADLGKRGLSTIKMRSRIYVRRFVRLSVCRVKFLRNGIFGRNLYKKASKTMPFEKRFSLSGRAHRQNTCLNSVSLVRLSVIHGKATLRNSQDASLVQTTSELSPLRHNVIVKQNRVGGRENEIVCRWGFAGA